MTAIQDDQAPATKGDLAAFGSAIQSDMAILRAEILHMHEALNLVCQQMVTKDDLESSLESSISQSESRMKSYIDVKIENLTHDLAGAASDRHQQNLDRFARIEKHIKLTV